ncbi:MAG: helix-turn-helix domain-containing protein [Nitrospinales bacterium]
MVALSRETLTRVLYEFQNLGCLQVKGKKITIHNEGRLKEIIEQV